MVVGSMQAVVDGKRLKMQTGTTGYPSGLGYPSPAQSMSRMSSVIALAITHFASIVSALEPCVAID